MPTSTPPVPRMPWGNWAGNQRAHTAVCRPGSVGQLVEVVRQARADGRRVKPVGSGHSFTGIALTDRPGGLRLDLTGLTETAQLTGVADLTETAGPAGPGASVRVDRPGRRVTVPAGIRLRELNQVLAGHQLALPNLGDIDEQTVAGAISTGTHGTGAGCGCLSTFVEALTLVTGTGEVLRCSPAQHPDVFAAARVGLGALGVLVEVTLRCVDGFVLHAEERPLRLVEVLGNLDALIASNDHFEFYWFPYTEMAQVKRNNRVPADDRPLPRWRGWLDDEFLANTVFAGVCRLGRAVPAAVPAISAVCARALSARQYTARSDKVFCTPRRVRFVEMEYGVPRDALPEAFAGLRRVVESLPFKVLFPVEVRFAAADDIWLSHGYRRDSAYLAIHQYAGIEYEPYFRAFERLVTPLGGRPHWGKLHYRDAQSLRPAYPRFDDFLAVRDRLDPDRIFANSYLDRVLGR